MCRSMFLAFISNRTKKILFILFSTIVASSGIISCDDNTDDIEITEPMNVILEPIITVYEEGAFNDDYVLLTPFTGDRSTTYLLDRTGAIKHEWSNPNSAAFMAYLKADGSVVRSVVSGTDVGIPIGGKTGVLEIIDRNNNVTWRWSLDTPNETLHHDIALLPNGNILASTWKVLNRDMAITNGRDPASLTTDRLVIDRVIEIMPVGTDQANIVWEWSVENHFIQEFDFNKLNYGVIANNPQKLDINYSPEGENYTHINGLEYIESLDQIIINSRVFNEFFVIDHNLTTTQAAGSTGGRYGKGGDILYRWGNPITYGRGTLMDRQLHEQHDATYVGTNSLSRGTFLVFDNQDDPLFSTIKEINIPVGANGSYNFIAANGNQPSGPVWSYSNEKIQSQRTSGAQRLENGNTLINSTSGEIIREVTYSGQVVWELDASIMVDGSRTTINATGFKCRSYIKTFPGVTALGL